MSIHPEIQTVVEEHHFWYKEEEFFKPMDLVHSSDSYGIQFGIVLMGPISVPYYEDGCASDYSSVPLDIENEKEWQQTFDGYIVYDLVNDDHRIISHDRLTKINKDMHGYVPFDHGTSKLRLTLGLIQVSSKWKNVDEISFFKHIANTLNPETK